MQTQQTQFIGLTGFSAQKFYTSAVGGGSVPAGGLTIMALFAPLTTVDPSDNEHLFGNLAADGSTGFSIQRTSISPETYTITGSFGDGASSTDMAISVPASAVAGHPIFAHYVYDGGNSYASYLNGMLIETATTNPFVSSPRALTYGYSPLGGVAFTGLGITVGISYAVLTGVQIFEQIALAMKTRNVVNMTHLWSSQNAVRDTPEILFDYGTAPAIDLTLGDTLTPRREIWDVQFSTPFAEQGVVP